ncbi:hypothetical protein [Mesorhizobium sp. M0771]|uniref:hypothetical protein n=1 Tax=Mesorhizobium sp. M0771 TaxID=2956997 RepID=UPI00333CF0C4
MCDLGLVLGIGSGIASVAGQASAASKNQAMVQQQTNLEYAQQEREFVVENNAALKDGYQAQLEGDRAKSTAVASGAGMNGNTAGLRLAEQSRQQALSIANARDRADAAKANYVMAGKSSQIAAQNKINTQAVNPMTAFMDIATSGMRNYGAFQ